MNSKNSIASSLIGLCAYGSVLAGVLGVLGAVIAFIEGDSTASGIFLIASALAFGLMARAVMGE
ncbi:MAG: hypothetical protein WBM17_14025 [Anaerolineales bacterium]